MDEAENYRRGYEEGMKEARRLMGLMEYIPQPPRPTKPPKVEQKPIEFFQKLREARRLMGLIKYIPQPPRPAKPPRVEQKPIGFFQELRERVFFPLKRKISEYERELRSIVFGLSEEDRFRRDHFVFNPVLLTQSKTHYKIRYQWRDINTPEDFLYAIKLVDEELPKRSLVSYVLFRIANSTRWVSFGRSSFRNITIFMDHYNRLRNGNYRLKDNVNFSDKLDEGEDIDFNTCIMFIVYPIAANSKSNDMLFLTKDIESDEGTCVYECFKSIGIIAQREGLDKIDNLIKFIKDNELNIVIIENVITQLTSYPDIKLELSDVGIQYILPKNEDYGADPIIFIYDSVNKHMDVAKDVIKLELHPGVNFATENKKEYSRNDIIKNDKLIHKEIILNDKIVTETKLNYGVIYVFFSIKYVENIKTNLTLQPYIMSILKIKKVDGFYMQEPISFVGFDCINMFSEWIIKNQHPDERFKFISYNNSNICNFSIFDELLPKNECRISHPLFVGNMLLDMVINGRHSFFDLHRHLQVDNLETTCENFKVKYPELIDENDIQIMFNNNDVSFIKDTSIKKYNEDITVSICELFYKYKESLSGCKNTKKYGDSIEQYKTLPSTGWKIIKEHNRNSEHIIYDCNIGGSITSRKLNPKCKKTKIEGQPEKKFKFPRLPLEWYNNIKTDSIAGRVDNFNNKTKTSDPVGVIDCTSAYPYVMCVKDVFLPYGESFEVTEYIPNKMGLYLCDIDQSALLKFGKSLYIPKKENLENNWNCDGIIENMTITSVDYDFLMSTMTCKIKIKKGIVFNEAIRNIDVFRPMLEIMKLKNQQDEFKTTNDSRYNPALRESYKLLLNSISGKCIEGIHNQKTEMISTVTEYYKLKEKIDISNLNTVNIYGGKAFISYDDEITEQTKQQPVIWGAFIYSHARMHMYQYAYAPMGFSKCLYTHTDSLIAKLSDLEIWKNKVKNIIVPHWEEVETYDPRYKTHTIYNENSKVFGSFEMEMTNKGTNSEFMCLGKNLYFIYADKYDNSKYKNKIRAGGVNGNSIILNKGYDFNDFTERDIQEYYISNQQQHSLNNNPSLFFNQLWDNRKVNVLSQITTKNTKNNNSNVGLQDCDKFNKGANRIHIKRFVKCISLDI